MILSQIVIEMFKSLIGAMEPWKSLKGSQFVQHLAIMLGWSIEDASYKVERAHQEGFLDTAINRSSILAHGEDREYIPRKPTPGRGKANIINQGGFSITLLRGMEFMSDGQNQYCLNETTVIPAYSTVEAAFTQSWKEEITHEITEEKPFYEILFGRDISPTVMDFSVHVDESGRGEFELWVYNRRFFNVGADASCYDEFYHYTDQIGIRFGNGIFGRIPPKGAIVKITMTRTLGDVFLLSGQTLYPIEELTYPNGEPASISIEVSETIQDGPLCQESCQSFQIMFGWGKQRGADVCDIVLNYEMPFYGESCRPRMIPSSGWRGRKGFQSKPSATGKPKRWTRGTGQPRRMPASRTGGQRRTNFTSFLRRQE